MFETYPFPCRNIHTILSYQRLFICNEFTIDATPGSLPPPRHKRRGERDEAQRLGNELGKLPIHHAGFQTQISLVIRFSTLKRGSPRAASGSTYTPSETDLKYG